MDFVAHFSTPIDWRTDSLTRCACVVAAVCTGFNCIWTAKPTQAKPSQCVVFFYCIVHSVRKWTLKPAVVVVAEAHMRSLVKTNKQTNWEPNAALVPHTNALGWNIEFKTIHSFACGMPMMCLCVGTGRGGGVRKRSPVRRNNDRYNLI